MDEVSSPVIAIALAASFIVIFIISAMFYLVGKFSERKGKVKAETPQVGGSALHSQLAQPNTDLTPSDYSAATALNAAGTAGLTPDWLVRQTL